MQFIIRQEDYTSLCIVCYAFACGTKSIRKMLRLIAEILATINQSDFYACHYSVFLCLFQPSVDLSVNDTTLWAAAASHKII